MGAWRGLWGGRGDGSPTKSPPGRRVSLWGFVWSAAAPVSKPSPELAVKRHPKRRCREQRSALVPRPAATRGGRCALRAETILPPQRRFAQRRTTGNKSHGRLKRLIPRRAGCTAAIYLPGLSGEAAASPCLQWLRGQAVTRGWSRTRPSGVRKFTLKLVRACDPWSRRRVTRPGCDSRVTLSRSLGMRQRCERRPARH